MTSWIEIWWFDMHNEAKWSFLITVKLKHLTCYPSSTDKDVIIQRNKTLCKIDFVPHSKSQSNQLCYQTQPGISIEWMQDDSKLFDKCRMLCHHKEITITIRGQKEHTKYSLESKIVVDSHDHVVSSIHHHSILDLKKKICVSNNCKNTN